MAGMDLKQRLRSGGARPRRPSTAAAGWSWPAENRRRAWCSRATCRRPWPTTSDTRAHGE